MRISRHILDGLILCCFALPFAAQGPGTRVLLDAHNCYPYEGRFADRIERALKTGVPMAIEQDLAWDGKRSVVSHEKKLHGGEPTMKEYFFERVRPMMEEALRRNERRKWPLLVLNLDFKTNEPEHHRAVWELLGEYEAWLTTAKAGSMKLNWKPILVLTGDDDGQERVFTSGDRLRVFGAVKVKPGTLPVGRATAYRRWWNNPWAVVEAGGQAKAGEWTAADEKRLLDLTRAAHQRGLWIRFYTLNGHTKEEGERSGWFNGYNFGSREAAKTRWDAARRAKVDFIATDQYEDFAAK